MQCSVGSSLFRSRPVSTELTDGRCTNCSTKKCDCRKAVRGRDQKRMDERKGGEREGGQGGREGEGEGRGEGEGGEGEQEEERKEAGRKGGRNVASENKGRE